MTPTTWIDRSVAAGVAAGLAVLAWGWGFKLPWAVALWPWAEAPMSHVLLAAIAAGMAVVWAALARSGDAGGWVGMGLYFITSGTLMATYLGQRSVHQAGLGGPLLWAAALLLLGILALRTGRRARAAPGPALTPLVRGSFIAFAVVLLASGLALVLHWPAVLPWRPQPPTASLIGGLFIGAAAYYAHEARRSRWSSGGPALAGFLAYDLVLAVPYVRLLFAAPAALADDYGGAPDAAVNMTSLVVYLVVIVASAGVALWAFLVDPRTRCWRRREDRQELVRK